MRGRCFPVSGPVWAAGSWQPWAQCEPRARSPRGWLISRVTLPERGWARRPCPSLPPPRTRQRNRPVESGAQLLGCFQRQLNPSPRPGFEARVDEVERDDVAQRRMARVVICNHRLREREPFVPVLCYALCTGDLDNGRAHVRACQRLCDLAHTLDEDLCHWA